MKRRFKKNKFFKLNIIFVFLGLIFFIISILFIIRSDFFKIKSIDVNLDKISCTDRGQIKDVSSLVGQNIFFINSEKIKENIINKFICVKDVNTSRQFPDKINLYVSGRIPVANLKITEATSSSFLDIATPSAKINSDSFLVDSEGVIFSKGEDNIPSIYLTEKLEKIPTDVLKVLDKLKIFGIDPQKTILSQNFLIIFSDPKIVFRLDNIDIQLASLQLILEKAKIDINKLEFVDLRFDKPTIRFAPKK